MDELKRYKFREIFEELADGSLSPKRAITINNVTFQPGTIFQKGVVFGGVDFHLFKYRDIAIAEEPNSEGPLKIAGFYQD